MVVQHDSLKDFVGPGKNNTLSMHYLEEHIDEIYPKGYFCTSRSAIANDSDTINNVVRKVVEVEKDSNDYYVAGDINLEWVMYAEIVGEIILAIVTWGGSTIVEGAIQTARIVKDIKNLSKTLKGLMKMDKVKDFLKIGRQITQHADDIAKLEKTIQHADDYAKIMKNIEKAEKAGKDATKYRKEAEDLLKAAKKVDSNITPEKLKNTEKLKNQRNEIKNTMKKLEKDADDLAKQHKEVKEFKEASETYGEAMKYYRNLRAFKRAKTGNIVTRTLKSFKTLRTGGRTLRKANRVARAGLSSRSAKIGSWLMDNTLKHGSRLARFEAKVGLAYGAVALVGDMFDYTSSTSKEFSNGIVFKPYCLLSADDLEGQDNVVNYGMWLMWEGNSTDTADDDAAYLQAMDFAAKLEYQLNEYQSELPPVKVVDMMLSPTPVPRSAFLCNVDIYVVHPIIRLDESNTDDPKGELYYLFMNEIPWTTAEQFGEAVPDIQEWERNQQQLYDEDGHYKHTKKPENNQNAPNTPENNSNDNTQTPENDSGVLK
jgi:tetratricopeptide (TPR) repeat protein